MGDLAYLFDFPLTVKQLSPEERELFKAAAEKLRILCSEFSKHTTIKIVSYEDEKRRRQESLKEVSEASSRGGDCVWACPCPIQYSFVFSHRDPGLDFEQVNYRILQRERSAG